MWGPRTASKCVCVCRWLGQNSRSGKNGRLLTELSVHMCLHTSGGRWELRQSYLSALIILLSYPLLQKGQVRPHTRHVELWYPLTPEYVIV